MPAAGSGVFSTTSIVDPGAQPPSTEGSPLAARASTSTIKTEPHSDEEMIGAAAIKKELESDVELIGTVAIKKEPKSDVELISHPQPTVQSDSDSDILGGPTQLTSTSALMINYDSDFNFDSDSSPIRVRHASTSIQVKEEAGTAPASRPKFPPSHRTAKKCKATVWGQHSGATLRVIWGDQVIQLLYK
jgi:hypothetical protein